MKRAQAAIQPEEGEENAYLKVDADQIRQIHSDTVWAKIGDDGKLEVLRWDLIEAFSRQYDVDNNNRSQTHVMCKLLVLVRDQVRQERA